MTELSLRIFADTFKIAAVAYGCPKTGSRMLAYPGWLDNAGSFKTLAPELAKLGFYVVAIDPPGCGHSDHLPFGQTYNDFDEVAVVLEVADCLGWSDAFHCMAHSRGGGICAAAVGSFPARFKSLIGLDTFLSLTTGRWLSASQPDSAVDAPTLMRLGHEMERRNRVRESRKFASFDEAVEHSVNNPWFPKSRSTAVNIVERHITPIPSDPTTFIFMHDLRTYGQRQLVHATENMMLEFITAISCPVLVIEAERHSEFRELTKDLLQARMNAVKDLTISKVKGQHHVHSDEPVAVANEIRKWFLKKFPADLKPAAKL